VGWQRFNRTTNVFEVSDNNGGSWETLVIAAAGVNIPAPVPPTKPNLPVTIAYEDEVNYFFPHQVMLGSPSPDYSGSALEIQVATPRISFHWPGVVASQIGMDTAGAIRTYDNPGTGYAPFKSGIIYTTGHIYPGHYGNAGIQTDWFLSGHGSYGLFINTGLYVTGNVWCGGQIIAAQGSSPRVQYGGSGTTYIAPNENAYDMIAIWDLAQTLTIGAGGGSRDGFAWTLRVRDNGVARALAWDANYMSACGVALPSQTAPSRTLYMGFRWNTYYGRWHMIAVSQE
jgi:hypothetical protein